ncbi:MAG TPA: sigma-70 family RNA polymerase sigma factor [Candidatus Acidoferrum sp.]|nr:sigma-70 family RNA polymerase sigma factor [Candidatus Acidoferrum sp.]
MSSETVTENEPPEAKVSAEPVRSTAWTDARLVRECIKGNEAAWSALIDKYKNLIYSIPVKYGFSPDEASDVFQAVCVELLGELPKIRKPAALPKWIMQVTAHKCFRDKRQRLRVDQLDENHTSKLEPVAPEAEGILREAEEEHHLRQAMAGLPPRCQKLVRMLFFEDPAREYREIAKSLGIAVGSIGFIRQRCLDKLRRHLADADF